jgi:hypothetical protein
VARYILDRLSAADASEESTAVGQLLPSRLCRDLALPTGLVKRAFLELSERLGLPNVEPRYEEEQSMPTFERVNPPLFTLGHKEQPKLRKVYDPADPQKDQWGGKSARNNRQLSATVTQDQADRNWFLLSLEVSSTSDSDPMKGKVRFHLHPTFLNAAPAVPVRKGKAVLTCYAWGAFTVGVEADDGRTRLELDLSELKDAPSLFRSR